MNSFELLNIIINLEFFNKIKNETIISIDSYINNKSEYIIYIEYFDDNFITKYDIPEKIEIIKENKNIKCKLIIEKAINNNLIELQ